MHLPVFRVFAQIVELARFFRRSHSKVSRDARHLFRRPLNRQFVARGDDSDRVDREDVGQLPARFVLLKQRFVARYEQAQWRSGFQQVPLGTRDVVAAKDRVLAGDAGSRLARPPEVGVPALRTVRRRRLHEQTDRYPLLDVEHVLVLAAVRGALLLLGVAVQVEQEHAREGSDQAFAHAAERGVVQVAVVGDESKYAVAGAVDRPLREADELYVVVVQPLGVAFVQRLAVHRKVACRGIVGPEQVTAPRSLVC